MTCVLDAVEDRARGWLGTVEETRILPVRRQDLQTWAAVTRDVALRDRLADGCGPAEVSGMYLVGQLQPGAAPWHDRLRPDGLAHRDSPGADVEGSVGVMHGGGDVTLHGPVREGVGHLARREVVAVERKGRAHAAFVRVRVRTRFTTDDGAPVADLDEYILLREV